MYATFLILYLTPAVLPSTFICAYVISASVCVVSVCARCNCDQQLLLGEQSKERERGREQACVFVCPCVWFSFVDILLLQLEDCFPKKGGSGSFQSAIEKNQ